MRNPLLLLKVLHDMTNEKNREMMQKKKPGRNRAFMMDGLVSIRKFLSQHNIKNKFSDYKNFSKLFYSHFLIVCGKWQRVFNPVWSNSFKKKMIRSMIALIFFFNRWKLFLLKALPVNSFSGFHFCGNIKRKYVQMNNLF